MLQGAPKGTEVSISGYFEPKNDDMDEDMFGYGQEDGDEDDDIDDEEEGGVWVTEENIHKHLANGLVKPLIGAEEDEENKQEGEENKEVEQENEDFPAFDEN